MTRRRNLLQGGNKEDIIRRLVEAGLILFKKMNEYKVQIL